jgi:hypothetical protein
MKCRDCKFLSEKTHFKPDDFGKVHCNLGLWDKVASGVPTQKIQRWYSWGESQLNHGPIKRLGAACTKGRDKNEKGGAA